MYACPFPDRNMAMENNSNAKGSATPMDKSSCLQSQSGSSSLSERKKGIAVSSGVQYRELRLINFINN
jgi:hypothetical protein